MHSASRLANDVQPVVSTTAPRNLQCPFRSGAARASVHLPSIELVCEREVHDDKAEDSIFLTYATVGLDNRNRKIYRQHNYFEDEFS